MIKQLLCFAMILMTLSCAVRQSPDVTIVLWAKTAAEYQACGFQAYTAARMSLEAAIADQRWTASLEQTGDYFDLPPAVIFDIDETVLDNSEFQGWLALNRSDFDAGDWDWWGRQGRAGSIAGAVEFIHHLQDLGIAVIFITNRGCDRRPDTASPCPQEAETLANLTALSITGIPEAHLLLKNEFKDWGSDKTSRRAYIAEKYRILMLFGDDLGDFIAGVQSDMAPEKRREITRIHEDLWGRKWFILPNPMYGSWRRVLSSPVNHYLETKF